MYMLLRNSRARMLLTTEGNLRGYALGVRHRLAPGTDQLGAVLAISAETGRTLWIREQRAAIMSLVATGGALVFGGDVNGRFRALDQETGVVFWEISSGSTGGTILTMSRSTSANSRFWPLRFRSDRRFSNEYGASLGFRRSVKGLPVLAVDPGAAGQHILALGAEDDLRVLDDLAGRAVDVPDDVLRHRGGPMDRRDGSLTV